MSRQSSQMPDGPQVPRGKGTSKKRKGNWEIWKKYNSENRSRKLPWMDKWILVRSYETEELAKQAYKKFLREFPRILIEYQIRYRGKPVDEEVRQNMSSFEDVKEEAVGSLYSVSAYIEESIVALRDLQNETSNLHDFDTIQEIIDQLHAMNNQMENFATQIESI